MAGDYGHYEFNQWEEMFKDFYSLKKREKELQLIISTHWASPGYWFEIPPIDIRQGEYAYKTKENVEALEMRVKQEIEDRKKTLTQPGLIL